jgi:SAM-dependent methyltransferase
MTLFNVGCGGGYFNSIAHAMGLRVVACEPVSDAYELAVSSAPDATIELRNCGLHEFAQSDRQADFVVFHDVLEHLADDAEGVADIWRLAKPTGRVVISVPALQWLFGRHDEELGHFRRYTSRSLRKVLDPYFEIVKMRYFGALSIPIALGFSRLMRRSYPRSAADGSALARAYGKICDLEVGVTFPIGTSILAELVPKAVSQ